MIVLDGALKDALEEVMAKADRGPPTRTYAEWHNLVRRVSKKARRHRRRTLGRLDYNRVRYL